MRNSDEVLEAVLSMAGLQNRRLADELIVLERHVQELALMVRALSQTGREP